MFSLGAASTIDVDNNCNYMYDKSWRYTYEAGPFPQTYRWDPSWKYIWCDGHVANGLGAPGAIPQYYRNAYALNGLGDVDKRNWIIAGVAGGIAAIGAVAATIYYRKHAHS
jgi:hypothetical protein